MRSSAAQGAARSRREGPGRAAGRPSATNQVVLCQDWQRLVQILVKQEGAVARVNVHVGVSRPHLGRKLARRQRHQNPRPARFPLVDAGVDGRRLPGARRPQRCKDLRTLRRAERCFVALIVLCVSGLHAATDAPVHKRFQALLARIQG